MLLLATATVFGQTLPSRRFSLAEGLPETSVIALAQDGGGRLWVVTEVGAAWYDGHDFHSLTTQAGLPNTRVSALAADPGPAAGMWLGFRDGSLCYFDPATARVRRVMPRVPGYPAEVRAVLARDSGAQRRVWVGTAAGEMYCLRWPATTPQRASRPAAPLVQRVAWPASPLLSLATSAPMPNAINALAPGPAGGLWVGTDHGLRLLDETTGRPRALPRPLPPALDSGAVLGLRASSDGRLWCATPTAGLFVLDPADLGGRVRQYTTAQGLCSNRVLRAVAAPGPAGRVWILTGNGLSYLASATASQARCLPGTGLVSHSYRRGDLLLDREGNLWATSADGLTQYPPDGRFTLYGPADGLPGFKVYALARGLPGEYWVGTNDGLAILRPGAPTEARRCQVLPKRSTDVHNIIRALLVRGNGDVWVGATKGGTAVWQSASARWQALTAKVPPLGEATVTSLAEDEQGRIWLGTESNGLIIYNPATNHFEQYVGPTLAGARRVMKVFRARAGTMWLGTEGAGLLKAEAAAATGAALSQRFRPVAPRPAGAEPLSVFSISENNRGELWLTSFGEGMFTYHPARPTLGLRRVPLQGQPGAHIDNPYFVQCDAAGAVWLGTTRGLMRYEPATGQQTFFGREDGFIGQETGINAVLADSDGTLWAGTVAGLMRYTPGGARPNRVPPNPRLTGLRLFMRDTMLRPGTRLPFHLNHLTFDYAATSLTNPGRVRYRYRLAGFEQRWNGPLAARSATYTNLPPGDYTFELRAANEAGLWSPRPARFAFSIRPPWWRTWWAYVLYGCAFGFVLYGVRAYTRDRERERADRQLEHQALAHLQELDRIKTDFFTNVSHELRTPLTLILGPAETLAADPNSPTARQQGGLVLRNARKLLTLINQLLDLSKLEVGALRLLPTSGDAADAVRQLVSSFASLAKSRQITLRCETPPAPVPLVFDAVKLEEMLTNLLANALRFTPPGGTVVVTVSETPPTAADPAGGVTIAVRDTGPGIDAEDLPHLFDRFYQATNPRGDSLRTGTGIGLALVRELTTLHGGTVSVTSQPGAGATFTVQLPRELQPVSGAAWPAASPGPNSLPSSAPTAAGLEPIGEESLAEIANSEADVVLIVEDNEEVREFIRATLAPEGYRLLLAADGLTGAAIAKAEVPDLVVSDVMMPGLDGYQLCAQLKTNPATSHIPVVLLTAKSDPEAKIEGLETGADSFLAKPFNPRELRAQVRNLLLLRRRMQARFAGEPADATSPPAAAPVRPATAVLLSAREDHAAAVASLPSLDQAFLRRFNESVLNHLADEDFGVDQLGADIGMSRTQVHRKLKALTGQSPGEHIRGTRLHRARALLRAQVGTVAEIAYQVGFGSPAAFSTAFSRQFGYPPSAAVRQTEAEPDEEKGSR
ncbi:two-component regulator propeller domain-containing protein [Hymenobacter rubidus]|uniref:two-component regulator propeller domain-containing protein n=1 Tax=Hymenobacter rubidus TaxID=1441626 RepID=UPI00293D97E9|nr:two-component regulator propeller domain-containing protein [Hymenobacter rubidus]